MGYYFLFFYIRKDIMLFRQTTVNIEANSTFFFFPQQDTLGSEVITTIVVVVVAVINSSQLQLPLTNTILSVTWYIFENLLQT